MIRCEEHETVGAHDADADTTEGDDVDETDDVAPIASTIAVCACPSTTPAVCII